MHTSRRNGRRRRITFWAGAAFFLLLPLVAMQFSNQVAWSAGDFAIFGTLLAGVGITLELASRKTRSTAYRMAVAVALAAAFILVWLNGAVGIIGAEDNDANSMFGGVLAVAVIGSLVARFKPLGTARAMFLTALAQAAVGAIAVIAKFGSSGPAWPLDILVLTGIFAALWLLSALLFRRAARVGTPEDDVIGGPCDARSN